MNGRMNRLMKAVFTLALALHWIVAPAAQEVVYYHFDALGSAVAATDETGSVLWTESYAPYGTRQERNDAGANDYWYTGKAEDESIGLSYFGARWYSTGLGRFMAVDPVEVDEANVHSFNRYAYANNNPYKYVDTDGRANVAPGFGGSTAYIQMGGGGYGGLRGGVGSIFGGVPRSGPGATGTAAVRNSLSGSQAAKSASNAPDFIVSPGGTAFPVAKGATGPSPVINPAGKLTGVAFTGGKGGAHGELSTMRIMDPTLPIR